LSLKEEDKDARESLDKAISIMDEQLTRHAKASSLSTLDKDDIRSVTDMAKTLVMIDKNLKDNPDDDDDEIKNMTNEELRIRAKEILARKK